MASGFLIPLPSVFCALVIEQTMQGEGSLGMNDPLPRRGRAARAARTAAGIRPRDARRP